MGKRNRGKGKGKRRRSAMTRRSGGSKSQPPPAKTKADDDAPADEGDLADDGDGVDAEAEKQPKKSAKKKSAASKKDAKAKEPEDGDDGDTDDGDADDADDATEATDADVDDDAADDDADADEDDDADDDADADDGEDEAEKKKPRMVAAAPTEEEDEAESHVGLPNGAEWALPLVKFEHRWTWLEVRMMFVALVALMLVLVFWSAMGSMGDAVESPVAKGTLFRMIVGASALGGLTRLATRKRLDESKRNAATLVAVIIGVATARFWRDSGIDFFAGLNDWLQKGSVFALFGGLKGISTRLTMFVSLVGGSLAAASGTHIAIDAVVRLVPKNFRKSVAISAACSTAVVCIMASWGFFDHVAITSHGAKANGTASEKAATVAESAGEHFFLLRKQLKLDMSTLPRVLASEKWNAPDAFTGADWNAFVDANGFAERYGEDMKRVRAPESALKQGYQPFVKRPGEGTSGAIKHTVDLMWPIGFLMLGLRFLLRAILIFGDHVKLEEELEETDDELATEGAA